MALALAAASVGSLLAGVLKQSLVLGYIAAGLMVGPFTPGPVLDSGSVGDLADIGVVLLMFAIGVQLSVTDLFKVGRVALIGGNIQVLLTIGVGFGVGHLLGWGWLESLFFGAVLSNSSSTVITKVLAERGEESSLHARIGLAWSTVQDLGTIVLVVLLTTLAGDGDSNLFVEVGRAVGLAALFLGIVIPTGVLLLPRFFDRVAATGSQEVFVLTATGIALGIAFLASLFGVSVALGAFVGGMLVGRSDLSHEVFRQIRPLRDLFAALFFVSVGMLIDPQLIVSNLGLVLITVALIIAFKGALSAGISLLFGYRGKAAVLAGASLAQCAEFSFVMARAGGDIGAISDTVFGVLLAGAAISIVLAPSTMAAARPLGSALDRLLPAAPGSIARGEAAEAARSGHAIIGGYGRVGRVIAQALREQGIEFVVIEPDGGIVDQLVTDGVPALQGSMSNEALLRRAGAAQARVLVVALPDAIAAREVVELGRRLNPSVDIVVRTHSESERRYLHEHGADEAVVGELELALEISRHTLERFGIDADLTQDVLGQLRVSVP